MTEIEELRFRIFCHADAMVRETYHDTVAAKNGPVDPPTYSEVVETARKIADFVF